jgi:aspartyl/asparaginyl beta-hydroxylase (cupin superfamily)
MMAATVDVEQLVRGAITARQQGDRARELQFLEQALRAAPGHPLVLNARGLRALADQDFAKAEDCFAAADAADPGQTALLMNLATARRGRGDQAGEKAALEAVLAIDQRHMMAQLRLAEWHEAEGNLPTAAEHWRHVLALAPMAEGMAPALVARIAEGRAFVEAQNADFAARLEAGLAEARAVAPADAARRFDACVDTMLGRRRIYVNECSGLHYPFLPADEFFDRAHFPWMAEAEAATPAIRAEFEALLAGDPAAIRPYVRQEKGTPHNRWSALDNRLDWGACFLWEYGVPNAPVLERCPETARMLERLPRNHIPGRAPTAFFSLLRPKTRIPPHTGVTNTRAIIHLPLIVPDGCGFRVGGETRQWQEGVAFAFDDTIEHEAWNDSDDLRVVLIFDVWNPHLSAAEQQLLVRFFAAADETGHNPAARHQKS